MTIHDALYSPSRQPLMTACLLLLTLQLALIFAVYRDGRSRKVRALHLLHFATGFAFLYFPLLDISYEINLSKGAAKALPAMLAAFRSLPVSGMIGYIILSTMILAAAFGELFRYRENYPTFESIKETMDLLPAGFAFSREDGTVVFSNLVMNRLSRSLTGKRMTDLTAFREAVPGMQEGEVSLTLPDGSAVWQFSETALEADGKPFRQLTATEITEQARITEELREKNAKLRDIHMRLDLYNKQADRIISAQELLTARMTVHNELGHVLLESRHYLTAPESIDESLLLQALKNTNTYLLKEYEEDDTARDPLTDALETADAIGVEVEITGIPPEKNPLRTILAAAVTECATNTVKHADGNRLCVEIRGDGKGTALILESNGTPPAGEIRETGGLASLRVLVEKHRGSMKTDSAPGFRLIIRMPEQKS